MAIERTEANLVVETNGKYPLISSLVEQLGVPPERVEECTKGLYAAFGPDNQPDERIIGYLRFKLAIKDK